MRTLFVVAAICVANCTNSPNALPDAADGSVSSNDVIGTGDANDAGAATDIADAGAEVDADWGFTAAIVAQCDGGTMLPECATRYIVIVDDNTRMGIDDAMIVVNAQTLPAGHSGLYDFQAMGFAANYDVAVTHAGLTLSTSMPSPSDFALTIMPSAPAVNTDATLTWTPSGDPNVEVVAQVTPSLGVPTFTTTQQDTGSCAIPGSAFRSAGEYVIDLQRRIYAPDQSHPPPTGGSPRNVGLVRRLTVTVP
jgi:hypothetical protein